MIGFDFAGTAQPRTLSLPGSNSGFGDEPEEEMRCTSAACTDEK